MLSLNIPSYSKPSGYQVSELPKPELSDPKDVVIKVHAASINPIDVKKADGMLKLALKDTYVSPCTLRGAYLTSIAFHIRSGMTVPA